MGETFAYGLRPERYMKLAHGIARQLTGYREGQYIELDSSVTVEVQP